MAFRDRLDDALPALVTGAAVAQTASTLLGPRLAVLLERPRIGLWQDALTYATAAVGALALARLKPRALLLWALPCFLVLAHAFATFFQPALRLTVSLEDYMLAPGVSANWIFGIARLYVGHATAAFLLFMGLNTLPRDARDRGLRALFATLALAIIVNAGVALGQRFGSMAFLTAGSGSAVESGRAPGLLEDSGASAVFFGVATAFLFWLFVAADTRRRLAMAGIGVAITGLAGFLAGGRVFYLAAVPACALGAMFLWAPRFRASRGLARAKWGAIGLALVGIVAVTSLHRTRDFDRVKTAAESLIGGTTAEGNDAGLVNVLRNVDAVRWRHMEVKWREFLQDPWFGNGLGSFHAAVLSQRHADLPGDLQVDWPSSLYLQLASELGVAGLMFACLLLGALAALTLGSWRVSRFTESSSGPTKWLAHGALGMAWAMISAWIIGVHVVFWSVTTVAGIALVTVMGSPSHAKRWPWRLILGTTACLTLLLGIISRIATAPRVPGFRWADLGHPQEPHYFRETIDGKPGRWLPRATEILWEKPELTFHVKHPPESYPVHVTFTVTGKEGALLAQNDATFQGPGWQTQSWPDAIAQACAASQPTAYCSIGIRVSPTWKWDAYTLGIFIPQTGK